MRYSIRLIQYFFSQAASEDCQKCLLEHAGAIHIEAIQPLRKKTTEQPTFWAVGAPKFFTTNLINCIAYKKCVRFDFVKSDALIVTNGINGETSTPSVNYKFNKVHSSSKERFSVIPDTTQREQEQGTGIHSASESVPTLRLTSGDIQYMQHCLYQQSLSFTALCEACIKRASQAGRVEKYFMYAKRMSILYVVHTQDFENFKKSATNRAFAKVPLPY